MATRTFDIDWIDIKGYEGLYKISTDGQILGIKSNKTLKPDINQDGYCRVSLYKDKECKHYSVHRLVAQTFLPNPDNLPEVNHKDEDKTNNYYENLEWCTIEYNNNYGTHNQKVSKTLKNKYRNK